MIEVKLRQDLEAEGVKIPAYVDVIEPDTGIDCSYLSASDLLNAFLIGDNNDETKPHYHFEHIQLKDGRQFYIHGIDLDYF